MPVSIIYIASFSPRTAESRSNEVYCHVCFTSNFLLVRNLVPAPGLINVFQLEKPSFLFLTVQSRTPSTFFVFKSVLSPILVRPSVSISPFPHPHPTDLSIPIGLFGQTLHQIHWRWSRVLIEKLIVAQILNKFFLPLLLPEDSLPYP